MSVSWEPRPDQPDTPTISMRCIRNSLIASAFCWAFIFGVGYLCYRLSFVI